VRREEQAIAVSFAASAIPRVRNQTRFPGSRGSQSVDCAELGSPPKKRKLRGAFEMSVGGFLGVGTHYVAVDPNAVAIRCDAGNKVRRATMNGLARHHERDQGSAEVGARIQVWRSIDGQQKLTSGSGTEREPRSIRQLATKSSERGLSLRRRLAVSPKRSASLGWIETPRTISVRPSPDAAPRMASCRFFDVELRKRTV
jgi:hypothetical protein